MCGLIANKEGGVIFSMLEASDVFKNQGKENPHSCGKLIATENVTKVEKRLFLER